MSAEAERLQGAIDTLDDRIDARLDAMQGLRDRIVDASPQAVEALEDELDRHEVILMRLQHERVRMQAQIDREKQVEWQNLVAFGIGAALGMGLS